MVHYEVMVQVKIMSWLSYQVIGGGSWLSGVVAPLRVQPGATLTVEWYVTRPQESRGCLVLGNTAHIWVQLPIGKPAPPLCALSSAWLSWRQEKTASAVRLPTATRGGAREALLKFVIIDDSHEIIDAVSLCLSLRWPGAEVFSASEGKRGLELVEAHGPDLVILDIGLPDMSGLEILRSLRSFSDVPVMILTIKDQDVEIARYLEEGADDYVVKPFSRVVLMSRIHTIFRRAHGRMRSASLPLRAGDLLMDFGAAQVYKAGKPVFLTRTELALLEHLAREATRVVTYESLASNMLQVADPADGESRLISAHVQHLRAKLGDSAGNPQYIANVYGIGYKFLPQVTSGLASIGATTL